jgi:hypothetical protein
MARGVADDRAGSAAVEERGRHHPDPHEDQEKEHVEEHDRQYP